MRPSWNSRYDDPTLQRVVWRRHALCMRHHQLAARHTTTALGRTYGVCQSEISAYLLGKRPLRSVSPAQRKEIRTRYALCQYHTAEAQKHSARVVYTDLGMSPNTHARIIQERKKIKEQRRQRARESSVPPVHRFLLRKAS